MILIAGLLALSTPTIAAEECNYISKLGKFSFVADGPIDQTVRLELAGHPTEICEYVPGDDSGGEAICPSGVNDSLLGTDWNGNVGDDVVVFLDQKWVKNCFEAV